MFADQLGANFAIFVVGCAAAVAWLRTGMVVRGVAVLVGLFVLADVALVARFAFDQRSGWFAFGLAAMQSLALGAVAWWGSRLAIRHWSKDRRAARELFAAAQQHYLRDEHEAAAALFRRLRRVDPWDVPAAIGLANTHWRRGDPVRARRLLRAARRLDRTAAYAHFVAEQLARLEAPAAAAPKAD